MPHHHIKPAQFELFALSDKANAVTTPEPSAIASSSLRPSSSAPMITHMHCLSWSSRGEK